MKPRLIVTLVVTALLACDAAMTAPSGSFSIDVTTNPTASAGKQMALSCLSRESVPLTGDADSFSLWIVPGASMDSEGNASGFSDLPNAGVTDFNARRIYVVQLYAVDRRAWAHEFLHVYTGARDHPDFFRACGLQGVRRRR